MARAGQDTIKYVNICLMGISEEKRKRDRIDTERNNFPKF
jgi:hypothetical protein